MAENNNNNEVTNFNNATGGLNMDQSLDQLDKGKLTYALNSTVENFDNNTIKYQNEPGNEMCLKVPDDFVLIGRYYIQERSKHLYWLVNPITHMSEIGYMDNNDCNYKTLVRSSCLGFKVSHPIHKIAHRVTNCSTEVYFTDGLNSRRFLNIDNIPYKLMDNSSLCDPQYTKELDCNQLKVQPNFNIPTIEIVDVVSGGSNKAGTVQFCAQYSDAQGNPYTSFYSVTNPTPINDPAVITQNFNYEVGKSVILEVSNLDTTGLYQYFNLAVIKTINNISSVELVGTYFIDNPLKKITYSGQNVEQIKLTMLDVFEKHPYYDVAQDLTVVQDVLVWDQLTSMDRINYQKIANKIELFWETYRIPEDKTYADEYIATNLRGYLRDEVYAVEIVFLLSNGRQTDRFHIPGRAISTQELSQPDVQASNPDFIGEPTYYDSAGIGYSPYWKIYNTGSVIGASTSHPIGDIQPYEYGNFAYWESEETYPCNEDLWGELAGKNIRHHKFPDVRVSPIFETKDSFVDSEGFILNGNENREVYPIGIKVDTSKILNLIKTSDLTDEQKDSIVGFKIVRGDRGTNKSIIGKGMLRNVGKYEREDQTFYFPNYPYNDLSDDPFINSKNNAYSDLATPWLVTCTETGVFEITDPNTGKKKLINMTKGITTEVCSITRPIHKSGGAVIGPGNYDVWLVSARRSCQGFRVNWFNPFTSDNTPFVENTPWLDGWSSFSEGDSAYCIVEAGGTVGVECDNDWEDIACKCKPDIDFLPAFPASQPADIWPVSVGGRRSSMKCKDEEPLTYVDDTLKYRQIFNSPETSFGQPFLGNVLKLENVIYGGGKSHFTEVRNNAKYKLITKEAQLDAMASAQSIALITDPFDAGVFIAGYQAYLSIYINSVTRKNYAYSFNSISNYNYYAPIDNTGFKQRSLDLKQYLIPGVQSVGDTRPINNYNRESSVFFKTNKNKTAFPYPHENPDLVSKGIVDKSRFSISDIGYCTTPGKEHPINVVSYYASLKNIFNNQWGQIYSYDSIDTGYQVIFNDPASATKQTVFGGDTFISRFTYKTKLPFFIDNRVGAPDDSDIFYDEIGNIGYPKYWHSARSILQNYGLITGQTLVNFLSYKATHFDCPNTPSDYPAGGTYGSYRTYYDGYFYLFAYGIPNFYCESSYNLDLRQAFNNKEGEFFPHVSTDIPDEWLQESFVSIKNDNTYTYNVSYSKQNKENTFTQLPPDWEEKMCFSTYPFRTIYSEPQIKNADVRVNNWLIYRPLASFDFPQNYGKLIALDGIQNKAVLARFENKSLLYNNLLTMNTSNPQAAYLGNNSLFEGAPPIDFAETDLGYVGSQHKFLLKIPQGQITVDAKRGQIFLISGTQVQDLTGHGSGVNRFITDHLPFEILNHFPNVNIDNNYNGIGLHGVYDSKFERIIITKLDYIPLSDDIVYDDTDNKFYLETFINEETVRTEVFLEDKEFFCNRSFTISFNFNTKSWISFHSYIPNFYIGENNFFYSGINDNNDVFEALVGEPSQIYTTTTTSTTAFTTTTTTTIAVDCSLEANGDVRYCELVGQGVITAYPSTTTTVAGRQEGLKRVIMFNKYQLNSNPEVDFSGSFEDAANAAEFIKLTRPATTPIGFTAGTLNMEIGSYIYYDFYSDSLATIDDGWYLTEESMYNNYVFHVVSGTIAEILYYNNETTTTTTTLGPTLTECHTPVFADASGVYYLAKDGEMVNLEVPSFSIPKGLGVTNDKLLLSAFTIKEWDIILSPFSATFNRTISYPGGFIPEGMIVNKTNSIIFAVESTSIPHVIHSLDITGLTAVDLGVVTTLPADRAVYSNLLYCIALDTLMFVSKDTVLNKLYFTQYNVTTSTYELDVEIIPNDADIKTIFQYQGNIFFTDGNSTGKIFVVSPTSPYTLVEVFTSELPDILTAGQISSCVNSTFTFNINYTTTTTTTIPV